MKRRIAAAVAATLAALAPWHARALPANEMVITLWRYVPGDVQEPRFDLVIEQGSILVATNAEVVVESHSVTSDATDEDGVPLFDTGEIFPGLSAVVRGASTLAPGAYGFYCSVHGTMRGVLNVVETSR